jgi:hypothetical protein
MAKLSKFAKSCAFKAAAEPQTPFLFLFVAVLFILLARTV